MRIVHLLYAEKIAGAEKYLMNLLPALKEFGVETHLICVCAPKNREVFEQYCEEMRSKQIPSKLFIGNKMNYLSLGAKINRYLRKETISIVHSHLINSDILAVIAKIFFNGNLVLISSKHGYDENYLVKYSTSETTGIDRNLYYHITKFLLSRINYNLAVSKAMADLYYNIKLATKPYPFIHHGVNPRDAKSIRTDTNLRFASQQLIIVGRLEKMKGHQYLIDALPKITKEFPSLKLLVIGVGTEEENLTNQVRNLGLEKNVSFLGFQSDPYSYITNSDVIILPSLFEPFGLVYIESFALKIPIVAFDVQATNEIITNNETGFLVPKYDYEALADKIIYLLKHPAERARISENAHQRYLAYYTTDRMAAETADWYKDITNEKSKGNITVPLKNYQ